MVQRTSRRAFLRSWGLRRSSPSKPGDDRGAGGASPGDGDGSASSLDSGGTLQFSLMTLFGIMTAVGILLGIAQVWPRRAMMLAIVTAALSERIYRKRIKATLGARRYRRLERILDRLFAVIGGGILGGVLGIGLSLLVLGSWSPVVIGVCMGSLAGLLYPRAVAAMCRFLP